MDASGLALALERASVTPPLEAHGVLVRRLRDLIEADELAEALSFITDVNKRMPGAPFAEVAKCLYDLENSPGGRAQLLQDARWQDGRRQDRQKAEFARQFIAGRSIFDLMDTLASLQRSERDITDGERPTEVAVTEVQPSADILVTPPPISVESTAHHSTIRRPAKQGHMHPPAQVPAEALTTSTPTWGYAATICLLLIGGLLLAYVFTGF
ncbi:MAG: hypothetical protein VX589_15290 [Myxococcota bacterium]|nr:hypothetical protein [Myxococcota bacterium]